ncbi:MAG: MarR family transcriptional regulator [Rhodospirillaceae bacterium]|nr:MarR family transcriptional regulator [Rhodospirillaceae bacterium]MBT5039390.1 MarR family transcriptional regulator [Rhodospirillaceae bacterium]
MSERKSGRFAVVPARAVEDRRLSPAALRVLCTLGTYGDRDGFCWPAMTAIAERIGISRQAVSQHVAVLQELGYLEIRPQKRNDGGDTVHHYRLLFDRALLAVREALDNENNSPEGEQAQLAPPQAPLAPPASPELAPILEHPIKTKVYTVDFEQFETFWRLYPSRRAHANPKKPAREHFDTAVKNGAATADVIRGAENFAALVKRDGTNPKFIPQAVTWLKQERWAEYQELPAEPLQEIAPL